MPLMPEQIGKPDALRALEQRYSSRENRLLGLIRLRANAAKLGELGEQAGVLKQRDVLPGDFPVDDPHPLEEAKKRGVVFEHNGGLRLDEQLHIEQDWFDADKGWWSKDKKWWKLTPLIERRKLRDAAGVGSMASLRHPDHPVEAILSRGLQEALEISLGADLTRLDYLATTTPGLASANSPAQVPGLDAVPTTRDLPIEFLWACGGAPGHFQVYVTWNERQVTVVIVTPTIPHGSVPEKDPDAYKESARNTKKALAERGMMVVRRHHEPSGVAGPAGEVITKPIPASEGGAGPIRDEQDTEVN